MRVFLKSVLKSPSWGGIGALLAVLVLLWNGAVWVIQVETQIRELYELTDQATQSRLLELATVEGELQQIREALQDLEQSPRDQFTQFSEFQKVRCPGGGDWLGRERNRREARLEFTAPEGRVIVEPVHVRVLSDNDGDYGPIEYLDHTANGEPKRVRVGLWCDPDNFPGAGGGWMELELYGEHRNATE